MSNLTKNEIAVLSTICDPAKAEDAKGDTGSTWTDAKEIANGSGMKLKSVIGVLGSLTKKGLIYVEDEVNGKKTDICCISEEGCDALMALTPEMIEAAPEAAPVEAAPVEAPAQTDLKAAIASGLSKCAAMRAVAKDWKGDRKSYLTAMKAEGMNAATSANSWLNGRK